MQLSKETSNAQYQIQSYHNGLVVINENTYSGSILVMPHCLVAPFGPANVHLLEVEHIVSLISYNPELVLIGTGSDWVFPPAALLQPLITSHIGVEIMNTGAACRTYTLLASEGRQVLALLLA